MCHLTNYPKKFNWIFLELIIRNYTELYQNNIVNELEKVGLAYP